MGSFVGFFPAEDPKIVITVVVDEAKNEKWDVWVWWYSLQLLHLKILLQK